ncbi:DUF3106 domain-containing protein [Lysobacter pythonis]|uniref:DUF3106 domain-containing protein n=1 Tax=Solilutibacter pythonis TaxID=2483112 RepID=A0A3M2HVI8_9GAMM|nr:DUF3106 domain-containing protein [Lysobacter pythonis]RMH93751.1 DUF3106 domain-containing protein [Lysobacter pythonis]
MPPEAIHRRRWPLWLAVLALLSPATAAAPQGQKDLAARIAAWQALTPQARREARMEIQAWRRLPAQRQAQLRDAAAAFAALPAEEQTALRARFAALPADERHGWRLGPALGPWYPRLQPLLGWVPEAERTALLKVLHDMPPQELEVLSRLAFSTPPAKRDALRIHLLRQPAGERLHWLRARLED